MMCDLEAEEIRTRFPHGITFFFLFLPFILLFSESTLAQSTGETKPVSVNDNYIFGYGSSTHPSISSDGRFIAYLSSASNLVINPPSAEISIYIYDRLLDSTIRLPMLSSESGSSPIPVSSKISADGRFVVFSALVNASTSHNNDSPGIYQIALYDVLKGELLPVLSTSKIDKYRESTSQPTLSRDGRFTVVPHFSPDSDQIEHNQGLDFLIYDRIRNYDYFVNLPNSSDQHDSDFFSTKISNDGRTVIYHSGSSPNLLGYFNRVTTENLLRDYSLVPGSGKVIDFDLSASGDILAFSYRAEVNAKAGEVQLYVHNFSKDDTQLIHHPSGVLSTPETLALSGNGNFLALLYSGPDENNSLYRIDLNSGSAILIDSGSIGSVFDITHEGSVIVYTRKIRGISQVFMWEEKTQGGTAHILAGQVTDTTSHPLALVTIQDNRGHVVRTDEDGRFWLNGISTGKISIIPYKEGFIFTPSEVHLDVSGDNMDLKLIYTHQEVLSEAQKDLGMPYSFDRGGHGPFHGYSAGYCTDLVLDAYTWGVDFNIQFALEQDYRARPWHFYRWRDARNAHDMWRYFSYSGQMQPHQNPYQPGDIVFFDWNQNGEIDHVAIVSEINSMNRPEKMYDATGVINSNPGGLAAELPWEYFHENTVRGFARWSGKYEPVIPDLPKGQVLQAALSAEGLLFQLVGRTGHISSGGVGIAGGRYEDWIWEETISIEQEFSKGDQFLAVIRNPEKKTIPYLFTTQFIENGYINGRIETKGLLKSGEINRIPLLLNEDDEGKIILKYGNLNRHKHGIMRNRR